MSGCVNGGVGKQQITDLMNGPGSAEKRKAKFVAMGKAYKCRYTLS